VEVVLASWAYCPDHDDYASTDAYRRGYLEMNEVIREVARAEGTRYYDFASEMPTDPDFWDDGRHNNERGARRKAELFAAFIADRVLRDR
jgi:hypothetical protein